MMHCGCLGKKDAYVSRLDLHNGHALIGWSESCGLDVLPMPEILQTASENLPEPLQGVFGGP